MFKILDLDCDPAPEILSYNTSRHRDVSISGVINPSEVWIPYLLKFEYEL
jgi:hypothetical protein